MHIGMVGLGRMGMNMTKRLLRGGHKVTAYTRNSDGVKRAVEAGAEGAVSLEALASKLPAPRVVWLMIPAGAPVDDAIDTLKGSLGKGDIIIDGGNSYYRDDIRREENLSGLGIDYLDVGTSGGIWGLENGYCMMVGGSKDVFARVEPILKTLAPPDGYLYCGPTGAGHFVKMVHNGIEYAMMEAYGEGFELLEASQYGKGLDYSTLSHLWMQGSVIRSWLLELIGAAFKKDGRLDEIAGYVEDSGEGRWMVKEAVDLSVAMPAISLSLQRRFRSRQGSSFAEKVLAAMRAEFGGHAVKDAKGSKEKAAS